MTDTKLTRRGFLRLTAAASGVAALAACAPGAAPAESDAGTAMAEGVTVNFWIFWGQPGRISEELLATPELAELMGPNQLEFRTAVAQEARLAAVAAGTPPDIGALANYLDFMARGVVVPLDDYVAASTMINQEDFIPGNWEVIQYQGTIYGIPAIECFLRRGLNYNAALVSAAGLDPDAPPQTWGELMVWHEALTQFDDNGNLVQIGIDPYDAEGGIGPGNDGWTLTESWGFSYFDEDTKEFNLDNELMAEGLETMGEFIKLIGPDNLVGLRAVEGQGTWGGAYNAGIQAALIEGYWHPGETFNEQPDIAEHNRSTWCPVPESRRGEKIQYGGGHMVQIFKEGQYKDEAWPVAEWLQTDGWCNLIFDNIGWLPAYKPYFDRAQTDKFPGLQFYFDSVNEATYWGPLIRCEIETFVNQKFVEARERVFRGEQTGQEAAASMQEAAVAEYKAAGFA